MAAASCNVDEHKFLFFTGQKSPIAHLLQLIDRKLGFCKFKFLTSFAFCRGVVRFIEIAKTSDLRTFARNFSNIDFFLTILPLKDDELAMSEM